MADAGEIGLCNREGHERADALLANEEGTIPALVIRPDQESSALADEYQIASALPEQRQGVRDVARIRLGARDRLRGSELRACRIIRNVTETQQVEHDQFARDVALDKAAASLAAGLQVSRSHCLHSGNSTSYFYPDLICFVNNTRI